MQGNIERIELKTLKDLKM